MSNVARVTAFIRSTAARLAECQVECTDIRDGIGFSNADFRLAFSLLANNDDTGLAQMLVLYRQQAGLADDKALFAEVCTVAGIDPNDYKSARSKLAPARDAYRGRLSWLADGETITFGGYTPSAKGKVLLDYLATKTGEGVWHVDKSKLREYSEAFWACFVPSITGSRLCRPSTFLVELGINAPDLTTRQAQGVAFWRKAAANGNTAGVELNVVWERRMGFRQSLRRKGTKLNGNIHERLLFTKRNTAAMRQLACYLAAFPGDIADREAMFDHLFPGYGREALRADVIITASEGVKGVSLFVSNAVSATGEAVRTILTDYGMRNTGHGFIGTAQQAGAALAEVAQFHALTALMCPLSTGYAIQATAPVSAVATPGAQPEAEPTASTETPDGDASDDEELPLDIPPAHLVFPEYRKAA